MDTRKEEWEASYSNGDNFVFYPNEEVLRFVASYYKKRVGINTFKEIRKANVCLDLGCGIGRHTFMLDDYGFDAYGIDLSEKAINTAKDWAKFQNKEHLLSHFTVGNASDLPYSDAQFDFIVSCSVLDSMEFEIAQRTILESCRVLRPKGLFCLDLIAGDDRCPFGEGKDIVVQENHEKNTIQAYYTNDRIRLLLQDLFLVKNCKLVSIETDSNAKKYYRYFLVVEKV